MNARAQRYLALAREGRNEWWRYLLGMAVIGFFWLVLGYLPYQWIVDAGGIGAATDFVGINLGILAMLAGVVLAVRVVHRRPVVTLIAPDRSFDWRRMLRGAALWSVLALAVMVLEHLLFPERYRLTFDYMRFVPFLVLVIALTPLQCLAEELLFRGYLMQGLGLLVRPPLAVAVASSLLFTLPHLANPEVERYGVWAMAANYFAIGMVFALVTLRDGRLELAIGMHAANNVLLALLANYEDSALQTESVFTAAELDPVYSLATVTACGVAFYRVMFARVPRDAEAFTRAELAQFDRDGYVVVRRLAPRDACARMLAAARAQLVSRAGPLELEADLGYPGAPPSRAVAGGGTVRRLLQACDRDPAYRAWATGPQLAGRLRQLLGPTPQLVRAHHNCVMTKSPGYSSVTGWHRDIRYWAFERPELVSVWTALGAERRDNGCLLVLPGTHAIDVAADRLDDAQFLRADSAENRGLLATAVPVELDAGDVLFFHCRLFHAAGRNETEGTKYAAVFTYHAADNRPLPASRSASMASIPI